VYLLDTSACIHILNGSSPELVGRLRRQRPSALRLCSVVKAELLYGARKSARPHQNLRLLDELFAVLGSLPFDDDCAVHAGTIRHDLERVGTPIGPHDLMIAATAMTHGAVLVTHNTGEFSRVLGLKLEDWETVG
jgi:tRNA(fMet)-specific endonuclease VapC